MTSDGHATDNDRMTARPAAPAPTALVLAGGNSLGAFQAGAYCALHDHGVRPDWIVGASIGAVNGAIIAGNPTERRAEALRTFWAEAAWPTGWTACLGPWTAALQRLAGQMQTVYFGTPAIFVPNFRGLAAGGMAAAGLYDLGPLRDTLERLVDFELLNRGDVRVTVVAVDLESGDEVLFDTRTGWVGPEHIMASGALIPEFRPIEIGGRILGDGGLIANLPIDVVWREPDGARLCIAVDLFSAHGSRFTTLAEATMRRQEFMFASQSRWMLEMYRRDVGLRRKLRAVLDLLPPDLRDRPEVQAALPEAERPDMNLLRLVWGSGNEIGNRAYDYSDRAVALRWKAGALTAAEGLRALADGRDATGVNAAVDVFR
jgi:NTE family protein